MSSGPSRINLSSAPAGQPGLVSGDEVTATPQTNVLTAVMRVFNLLGVWVYWAVKRFVDQNCGQLAASISYYALFSIFPLLIFSVGVIGVVLQDERLQQDLIDAVMRNFPLSETEGRDEVARAIREVSTSTSSAIGVVGAVAMAWAASAMFGSIRRSLNITAYVESRRPWAQQKLVDLALVIFFAPFFLLSIAATTALRAAETRSDDVPVLGQVADDLGGLWLLASLLLPMILSFLAFAALYALVPVTRPKLRFVIPGAIVAALLFELAKLGFSAYVENYTNYDVVFGSLGAVVAFMFWVYLSACILLLGNQLVAALPIAIDRVRQRKLKTGEPVPLHAKVWRILRPLFLNPKPPV
jgi:membrane protein